MEANLPFLSLCFLPVCFDAITPGQSGIWLLKSTVVWLKRYSPDLLSQSAFFQIKNKINKNVKMKKHIKKLDIFCLRTSAFSSNSL